MKLWGPGGDQDFWTARAAGAVGAEEQRAVALLAKDTDESRFSLYCRWGALPAMGNMTKRIYLIRRKATILELEDGRPKVTWCMNGGRRYELPETDHVVVIRALLEGEEYVFRTTANPSPAWNMVDSLGGCKNAYATTLLAEDATHARLCRQNEDFADAFESRLDTLRAGARMKGGRDDARFRAWLAHKARLEVARHGQAVREEPVIRHAQYGALGAGGIVGQTQAGCFGNATTIQVTPTAGTFAIQQTFVGGVPTGLTYVDGPPTCNGGIA